ncbi:MAG: hypothetical protein IPN29_13800 [Saprospiraceae bacterium]|nr:hypothetical protein [Saprospiraceae bacterium]
MKVNTQRLLPYFGALVIILLVNIIYFIPQFQGKVPDQGDIIQHAGMSKEAVDYLNRTGEETLWTNSMFGGMPTYQIAASNPPIYCDMPRMLFTWALTVQPATLFSACFHFSF